MISQKALVSTALIQAAFARRSMRNEETQRGSRGILASDGEFLPSSPAFGETSWLSRLRREF